MLWIEGTDAEGNEFSARWGHVSEESTKSLRNKRSMTSGWHG